MCPRFGAPPTRVGSTPPCLVGPFRQDDRAAEYLRSAGEHFGTKTNFFKNRMIQHQPLITAQVGHLSQKRSVAAEVTTLTCSIRTEFTKPRHPGCYRSSNAYERQPPHRRPRSPSDTQNAHTGSCEFVFIGGLLLIVQACRGESNRVQASRGFRQKKSRNRINRRSVRPSFESGSCIFERGSS